MSDKYDAIGRAVFHLVIASQSDSEPDEIGIGLIAAALRELGKERDALKAQLAEMTTAYNVRNDEVTGLMGMLAAAEKRGMMRAKCIVDELIGHIYTDWDSDDVCQHISEAIRAAVETRADAGRYLMSISKLLVERNELKLQLADAERRGMEKALKQCEPFTICRCDAAYTDRGRHESDANHLVAEEIKERIEMLIRAAMEG